MTYETELSKKNFIPNVVIRIFGVYFSLRQPDSGLTVDSDKNGLVASINLNATSIDPYRATTATNSNSFRIIDKNAVLSALIGPDLAYAQGELAEVWIGRVGVGMDFSEYYKATDTYISRVSKQDSAYTFQTKEAKDRLNASGFNQTQKLGASILPATTAITVQDASALPSSGLFKVNNEFISYTGIIGNTLQNCIRGEQSTTPASHDFGDDIFMAVAIQGNPITLLLQLLISSGGGGPYDVLSDGAAIDQTLIDVTEFESIRDEFFSGVTYKFVLSNIETIKKFIEDEILFPCGVRLRSNNNSKIGLAILHKPTINLDAPDLNNDEITRDPSFSIDDTKIVNDVRVEWDFDDGTGKYLAVTQYERAASIAQFGRQKQVALKFKGIRSTLNGQENADRVAYEFLNRFEYPRPQVQINTHMSSSSWLLGEKPFFESTQFPNTSGVLNFGESLEVIQKSINFDTGDVRMQLSFTQFTGLRACFIAPSDSIVTINSQSEVVIGSGRGDNYRVGWKIRLYNRLTSSHVDSQINEIASITGDTITFVDNWVTTLSTDFKIVFPDYDNVSEQQKKFCFISCGPFDDGKPEYNITC